jgi:hypothetical protein
MHSYVRACASVLTIHGALSMCCRFWPLRCRVCLRIRVVLSCFSPLRSRSQSKISRQDPIYKAFCRLLARALRHALAPVPAAQAVRAAGAAGTSGGAGAAGAAARIPLHLLTGELRRAAVIGCPRNAVALASLDAMRRQQQHYHHHAV